MRKGKVAGNALHGLAQHRGGHGGHDADNNHGQQGSQPACLLIEQREQDLENKKKMCI